MYTPPAFPAIETPPQEANRPSFEKCLASWKFAVAGRSYEKWPDEIVTSSHDEYRRMATALHTAKGAAILAGYPCGQNGSQSTNRMSMWISSGQHKIKVVWQPAAKGKRPQAVTQTSREAYAALDLGPKCEAVARVAIRLGVCTDNEVAREMGMVPSLVSARRNDIEKAGGIVVDGKRYALKMEGSKVDGVTGRRANTWALMAEVAKAVQAEMF